MKRELKAFIINPGSTSTKAAVYVEGKAVAEENLELDREKTAGMKAIFEQYDLRKKTIEDFLVRNQMTCSDFDYIVSRGGGGGNLRSGGYLIDDALVEHCYQYEIPHASSLGPVIARDMGREWGIPAFIYDGEGVNEFNRYARLSGLKEFPIAPGSHTLNAKAAARLAAEKLGGRLEDYHLVVCHLGGGSSTSAHENGKLVDSTSDGYSAERAGSVPFLAVTGFVNGCFSGKYTRNDIMRLFMGRGGLVSYLGTSDLREVERRMEEGDPEAGYYFQGMVYQQAKDICAMAAVLHMKVDAVVLTGGMAHSVRLVEALKERIGSLAPVIVLPGSYEMDALAQGGLRIMKGKERYHFFGKGEEEDRYYE